jgi:nucleoside-diphosphate-sugar epimerase
MRIVVAGATGALGKQLVPRLVEHGHEVTGMTRTPAKQDLLRGLGATPAVADALDPEAVARVVARAQPDAIIHELTALSNLGMMRNLDRAFAQTNRLRTEATDHLLAAGRAVGVKRFIAQSFAGWPAKRVGGPVKTEDDPFDTDPPSAVRETLAAIRYVEEAVVGAQWTVGIALRYGGFYGPGTSMDSAGGEHVDLIRKRRMPIVGNGQGVWSFIHIADAAEATVAALTHGERGVYNIVDDNPAPVSEWLPEIAAELGAKPPMRVPRFVGRALAGEATTVMMTEIRGASNAKARALLDWKPAHPSLRGAFAGSATA